jgi:hypothetical protein
MASWSFVLFATSLLIALNSEYFYLFTLPFIIDSALIVILAITAGLFDRFAKPLFWTVLCLHGLLFLPFFFAHNRWPGGDDGPGLAWLMLIGSGSFVALILAFVFMARND